jgi:hypothetical protein
VKLTKGVVDAHSPSHALLTLDSREDLGGILKSDWTFTQAIRDGEEINEAILISRDSRHEAQA